MPALLLVFSASAQDSAPAQMDLNGTWVINEKLSDDSDRQIEKAVRAAGGRIDNGGKRGRGRYRGGPADQELYDRMTYDTVLVIRRSDPEFQFSYEQGFTRVFYSDGRSRVVSASGSDSGDRSDFSFASWDGTRLRVESRPRDGGWASEVYSLEPGGQQLRVELELKPLTFIAPVKILRVYDRQSGTD
ncbi:MAG: hypothetical protein ACREUU_01360 [Gammaproteobacteria bacterium]